MNKIQFNKKQQEVINTLNKNILLLSSAGTGKTQTLTARIKNILKQNKASGEEILCLTFTNRGAKEMKEKVKEIGKEGMKIVVKTFHSFCFDVIKHQAKKYTDTPFDFTIYDEEDSLDIITEINSYKFYTKSLKFFIDIIKEKYLNYNGLEYRQVIDNFIKNNKCKFNNVCKDSTYNLDKDLEDYLKNYGYLLIDTYNKKLQERHALDFNDLIIKTYELFQNPNIREFWRKKFKYIHIDEVQDTSEIEYKIIEQLFKENNVMLSGDFYQTIYKWRGSNPSYILDEFTKNYNPACIVFNENYRSSKILLKSSFNYLLNAFGKSSISSIYKEGIEPKAALEGSRIEVKKAYNVDDEAQFIFNKIKELNLEDISKIAILTRNNKINITLSERFKRINSTLEKEERLKFLLVDEFKFFKRQEIKDVLAYLKLILNEFDTNSLKRIVKRFGYGLGQKTLDEIENEQNLKIGIRLTDLVNKNTQMYGEYYEFLIKELENNNIVVFDVESTGVNTVEDEIVQIAGIKINKEGKVIDKFEKFLKPSKPVGNSALIHGFSDEYLNANGENSKYVLKEFLNFIKDTVIVGHNVNFDISILTSQLERLCMNKPNFKTYYDTLDIARRFYPNLNNHKLETLSNLFNTNTKSSHDAMDDILATKDVLMKMIEEKIKPTRLERISICNKYLNKFNLVYKQLEDLKKISYNENPKELIAYIMKSKSIDINKVYEKEPSKINNIREFYAIARELENNSLSSRDNLVELLKMTALSNSEMDRMLSKYKRIPIITVHQSKGSEFDYVFLAGLEQNTFPSYLSLKEGNEEEEKRLFYVAITRAKKKLYLTHHENEHNRFKQRSELIDYIPKDYIKLI